MADHSERSKAIFGALELPKNSPLQQRETRHDSPPLRNSHRYDHPRNDQQDRPSHGRQHLHSSRPRREGNWRSNRGKRAPDHVLHPERWTRYDLSADKASEDARDLSEEQRNTFAAMSFLKELQDRKRDSSPDKDGEVDAYDKKPLFKKPNFVGNNPNDSTDCAGDSKVKSTWNHARVLPEYVVGAKVERKKRKVTVVRTTHGEDSSKRDGGYSLAMSHIEDEDIDTDESDGKTSMMDNSASFGCSSESQDDESGVESHDSHVAKEHQANEDPGTTESSSSGNKVGFKKLSGKKKQGIRQSRRLEELD